ncbi:HAMP domain-containing sensor histidine kinase [Lactococcus petauri]|uniref:HAMP domain-containing sensor histidine kinase n=1 Tax=Lactococcus petauri TaxID=1940789 RepID=UPI0038529FFE
MSAIKFLNRFKYKIAYKAFISIFVVLLTFTLLIYVLLILLFPVFYSSYQQDILNKELNKVVTAAESNDKEKLFASIDMFEKKTGITPILHSKEDKIIYMPGLNVVSPLHITRYQITLTQGEDNVVRTQISKSISFQNQALILSYSPKIRIVTDTTQVLMNFFPYFLVFALLLSTIISSIFSKKMVNPLQEMNKIALDMVNLNFTNQIKSNTKDEIGQLKNNLNNLGVALENALKDLQNQNQVLSYQLEHEREVEQLRESFIMAISHELKSPITASMGIIEAMSYNITPYDNHEKYLHETYNILENMSFLIQDMLDVSFLEYAMHSQRDNIDLNQELQNIITQLQKTPKFIDRKIIWSLDSLIIVQSNKVLVKKVLQNILSNAFLYSGVGGEIKIETRRLDKDKWYCSISNTSDIIPEEELLKLFEPFYRLEKSGNKQTGGNGLGLFLTQKFLTLLNIDYKFKSTENGVIFIMNGNNRQNLDFREV